jgi:signal peptidase I
VFFAAVAWAVFLIGTAAITALKGKWRTLALGLLLFPAWIVGAIRLAKPESLWARRFYDEDKRARARGREADPGLARVVLITAGVLGSVAVVALFAFFKTYRIPSSAMEPTLRCAQPAPGCGASHSDRILALRLWFGPDPDRGDIVTFEMPEAAAALCGAGGVFVKRVIALPGETVATRGGQVLVDGAELDEPYVEPGNRDNRPLAATAVPAESYFLMGDNRSSSCDSRDFGPIPRGALTAKVVFRYWPPGRLGTP